MKEAVEQSIARWVQQAPDHLGLTGMRHDADGYVFAVRTGFTIKQGMAQLLADLLGPVAFVPEDDPRYLRSTEVLPRNVPSGLDCQTSPVSMQTHESTPP